MARSAASIQAEIDSIETLLATSASLNSSVAADGVSRTIDRTALQSRLDFLYAQLERAAAGGSMFVRGVVRGL